MIVWLKGPLGAGKTTIAKGIARGMGIRDEITSPTYTLINEYPGAIPLYHMDLYRLGGVEDFEAMGGEEYLTDFSICLIEWAERIEELLPPETVILELLIDGDGRKLILEGLDI